MPLSSVTARGLLLADGTHLDAGSDALVGGGYTEIFDGLIAAVSDAHQLLRGIR